LPPCSSPSASNGSRRWLHQVTVTCTTSV
jgi:hypothetical protein